MNVQSQLNEASRILNQVILETPTGDVRNRLSEINILINKSKLDLDKAVQKFIKDL